jgi:hypothetical protein
MAKKSVRKWKPYSVCGDCMEPIDLHAVEEAWRNGEEYRHECGRVLVKAR